MTAFVISNAGGNWNAAASYVANSGFPVAGDSVTATGTSGNLTVNVASACASIILTNYVGTLTMDANLTTTSTVTFVSGMTLAGTAGTLIGAGASSATWTSGGLTIPFPITLGGATVYTMSGTWTVNGLVTAGSTTATTTINSSTVNCAAGLTHGGSTGTVTGTTAFKITAAGTWTGTTGIAGWRCPLELVAGAGTITIAAQYPNIGGAAVTLTYTSGTLAAAGSTVLQLNSFATITGFSGTTAATGQLPGSVIIGNASNAITLGSALNLTGDLACTLGGVTFAGAFGITCGSWTINGGSTNTTTLTGTVTATGALTLGNTTATTFSGNFAVQAGSCTILNTQTVTPASGQTFTITGTTTSSDANVLTASGASVWNTAGMTTTGALTGTQLITFTGAGTWTGAAGACSNSVTFAAAANTTLSGTILYAASGTPTMTSTAGGTITPGTSILSIASSCTLDVSNTLANVTLTAASTLTLSSLLTLSGTFTFPNAAVTMAGAGNMTVGTLTTATISAARQYTMDTGNTYTINTLFSVTGLTGGHVTFAGSAASGTRANMVLAGGASQSLLFVDGTDIDSSAGQPIFTLGGTLLRTINWSTSISAVGSLKAVGYAA